MSPEITHKKKLSGLYAITDQQLITEQAFSDTVELALQGGTRIIQYRDKSDNEKKRLLQASDLCRLCEQYDAISIINDDIALAKAVNADGVHLGSDDASITDARRALGDDVIIGISCYNDLKLAVEAEKQSADYVAFGAMFVSTTKPGAVKADQNILTDAKKQLSIPVCAIGGISENNIQQLIKQGTDMAAVISSLFSADDIKKAASKLSKQFP
ncbi:MAG: thiamine phosphate synthase [Gammaproteobacteria bacterium]